MLREIDTENVLDVKESSTDPKTAIITNSFKDADSQKWKYLPLEPRVRIIIHVYLSFLSVELAFSPPSNVTTQWLLNCANQYLEVGSV